MTARAPTAHDIRRQAKALAEALQAVGVTVGGARLYADGSIVVLSVDDVRAMASETNAWDEALNGGPTT